MNQSCIVRHARADLIVPVYSGDEYVRRCLASVFEAGLAGCELVVVDDASPDAALAGWLDGLAAEGKITLLRNDRNLGFTRSVNRALALHPDRDAVLLNSDTEVAGDWLKRLLRCADEHVDAATVTPFSNNATICSYPYEGWDGGVPGTLGLAGLNELLANILPGVVADIPTGIGFCMFVRRAALDRVGGFDEQNFPRGYGEENDLCRRAAKAGWRNLLCADVFVFHHGGCSFGAERTVLMREGSQRLLDIHEEYDDLVRHFIDADPLAPLRCAIDEARCAQGEAERLAVEAERVRRPAGDPDESLLQAGTEPYIGRESRPVSVCRVDAEGGQEVWLHVAHSWGGGIERWVQDMSGADGEVRHLLLRSRSWRNHVGVRLELVDLSRPDEALLAWKLEPEIGACAVEHAQYRRILTEVLRGFGVRVVVVSSLIGHALAALEQDLPTIVVLHDLFPFCPALFGWHNGECRQCGDAELRACFAYNPFNVFWHQPEVPAWQALRAAFARRLERPALRLAAPSRSAFERYGALLPELRACSYTLIPHGLASLPAAQPAGKGGRLRVVVPGTLAPHKGLDVLRAALPALAGFADVLLLGCGDFGAAFEHMPHVRIIHRYTQPQLAAHVGVFGPDCALLLSVLPETFSYTLSEMQALGVPVVATASGAFVERIEPGVTGFLVEAEPEAVVTCLRSLSGAAEKLDEVRKNLRASPGRTAKQMLEDYRALLSVGDSVLHGFPVAVAWLMQTLGDTRAREKALDRVRNRQAGLIGQQQAQIGQLAANLEHERAVRGGVENHAAALDRERQRLEDENRLLRDSTSWRITRPLRVIRQALGGETETEPPAVSRPVADVPMADEMQEHWLWGLQADELDRRRIRHLAGNLGLKGAGEPLLASTGLDGMPLLVKWRHPCAGADVVYAGLLPEPDMFACMFEKCVPAPRVCVVPTLSLARRFPASEGDEIRHVDFPLTGNWDSWLSPVTNSLDGLRARQREMLGVPDRCQLVVGFGDGRLQGGLLRFARMAMQIGERRNGVAFCWIGPVDEDWMARQGEALNLPRALRRLFCFDAPEFEPWLLAADAYYACRGTSAYDAGAMEALACGLSVVLHEPSAVLADGLGEPFAGVGPEALLDVLADPGMKCVPERGEGILARLASDACWQTFQHAAMANAMEPPRAAE